MKWPQRILLMIGGAQMAALEGNWQHRAYLMVLLNVAVIAGCLVASKSRTPGDAEEAKGHE